MRWLIIPVLVAWLTAAGCASQAPPPVTDPVTALDTGALAAMLTNAGLDAVRFDDHTVLVKDGVRQVLIFREDDGASLQAIFPYTGGARQGSAAAVARWNETRRYGRAYLDDDGGPTLASDLLLGAGVGPVAVTGWVELVLAMTPAFVAEVWPAAGSPAEPRNE